MHHLVLGITGSGKTHWTKKLVQTLKRAGKKVIVYDPFLDEWDCDFATDDIEKFERVFWSNSDFVAVIDESNAYVGKFDKRIERFATLGRHRGATCFFISQKFQQISPIVRGQCSKLIIFNLLKPDLRRLKDEYGFELTKFEEYSHYEVTVGKEPIYFPPGGQLGPKQQKEETNE